MTVVVLTLLVVMLIALLEKRGGVGEL